MFERRLAVAAVASVAWLACAAAQEGPGLGVPATPEQVAGWDVSIGPEGAGLPPGSGTAAAGKVVYDAKCVACHGVDGAGRPNDQLVGGQGTLREARSEERRVGKECRARGEVQQEQKRQRNTLGNEAV